MTALEARIDDMKLNFVQQALIHEEQKLNGHLRDASSSDSALVGAYERGKRGSQKPLSGFECGDLDHYCCNCPRLKKSSAGSMHKSKTVEEDY